MNAKNLNIIEDHVGRRIDNYLINVYKSLPKSKIYSMIRKGEIRVNSGRIKPTYKLKLDDEIRIPPYLVDFDIEVSDLKIPPSRIKAFNSSIIFLASSTSSIINSRQFGQFKIEDFSHHLSIQVRQK